MSASPSDEDRDSSAWLSEKGQRISETVEVYFAELQSGNDPDLASLVSAHPDLAPELESRLQFVQTVFRSAQKSAAARRSPNAPGPPNTPSPNDPSSTEIIEETGTNPEASTDSDTHADLEEDTARDINPGQGQNDVDLDVSHLDPVFPNAGQQKIDRFTIVSVLGRGSFSTVYKAYDPKLRRRVAIKVPRGNCLETPEDRRRFLREARNASDLHHPRIVGIHEIVLDNDAPFLVCEYIDGQTLAESLKGTTAQVHDTAKLIADIADALDFAHQNGVIHRDVKTSNILIDQRGNSYVTDFGLARRDDGDATVTLDGDVLGTPGFMPPEQAKGDNKSVGPASDIYSLGVVLYRMLCGEMPFRGSHQMLFHQVVHEPPRPPRSINERIPRDLETITLKAMEKDPRRRYQTARDMAVDLRRWLHGEPILATPASRMEKAWRRCRKNPVATSLSLIVLVLLLLSTIAMAISSRRDRVFRKRMEETSARADLAAKQSHQRLVQLYIANGVHRMDEHDWIDALLWFTHAMKMDSGLFEPPVVHQIRVGTLFRHCPKLTQFWLHPAPVNHVEFSPDGHFVLSASDDATAALWNADTGECIAKLHHESAVSFATFSMNGAYVVSVGQDAVRVWNRATGHMVAPLENTIGAVHAAFNPDSTRVAADCADGRVRVWDVKTGRLVREIDVWQSGPDVPKPKPQTGTNRPVFRLQKRIEVKPIEIARTVQFHPNGHWLLVAGGVHRGTATSQATIWDTETGKLVGEPMRHEQFVRCAVFSHDGQYVITAGKDTTARVWHSDTGLPACPPMAHDAPVRTAEMSPDGAFILTASADGTARVWDRQTGELVGFPAWHGVAEISAHFSPDGNSFVTLSSDGQARIWSRPMMELLASPMPQGGTLLHGAFAPDGRRVVVGSNDGSVRIWDLATLAACRIEHVGAQTCARFAPDGASLVTASRDGTARIWDSGSHIPSSAPMMHDGPVLDATFSPKGNLVATASADGSARLWELSGDSRTDPLEHGKPVRRVVFSPSGDLLATTCDDGTARVWDVATGKLRTSLTHEAPILDIAFHPDGQQLATACDDGSTRVWEIETGESVTKPLLHADAVRSVSFLQDGYLLVTGSRDKTVIVWDLRTGEPALPPLTLAGEVTAIAQHPSGTQLAIATSGGTVALWDPFEGPAVCRSLNHGYARVADVQYSPDGHFLLTLCHGLGQPQMVCVPNMSGAQIWCVETGTPVTPRLCQGRRLTSLDWGPDSRTIVTVGECGGARIWDLAPDTRPADDLTQFAGLLACCEIHEVRGPVPLSGKELQGTYHNLRRKYPASFSCSKAEKANWDKYGVFCPKPPAVHPRTPAK